MLIRGGHAGIVHTVVVGAFALAMLTTGPVSRAQAEEIALFASDGSPIAYVDTDDDLTIYLWSGEPVAYLEDRDSDAFHVWGFNGKHLGWFERGATWDRSGSATCAIKGALPGFAKFEPFKPFKKFKPFKTFKQLAPLKPNLTGRFGPLPCSAHLASGRN